MMALLMTKNRIGAQRPLNLFLADLRARQNSEGLSVLYQMKRTRKPKETDIKSLPD